MCGNPSRWQYFVGKKSGRKILNFHDEIIIFVDEIGEKSEKGGKPPKTLELYRCSLVCLMVSLTFHIFHQPRRQKSWFRHEKLIFSSRFFFHERFRWLLSIPHVYTSIPCPCSDGAKENRPDPLNLELPGSFRERLHISIPHFPKIPKIALRKLCDEAWSSIQHLLIFFPKF